MPPVKAEPASASIKAENARASNNVPRPRPPNGTANARSNLKLEQDRKDLPPPPPTTYRDIPLLSTDCGQWLTHLMKFAHHMRVDPNDSAQFIPPLKLNRKNPPRLKLPRPNPGDPITDKYNRPMVGKDGQPLTWPGPDDDLQRIEEVIKGEIAPKGPGADQSLIAPGASARPPKSKLFKKKVREIHKAADGARKTMKQEHFPWVLEDFETSEEWESIRTPIPTGARALQDHIDELKAKSSNSSNTDANGDVKMHDSNSSSSSSKVKPEDGIKQESGASSSTSHAPWIGKLEGDSSSEASSLHVLFVFDERDAGGFKVVPVSRMYKFLQKPKHSTMTNEQVEQEYQKYQKTKEMDRWALRNKPISAGSSVSRSEDSAAWRNWPQVNQLSLPTGMSFGAGRRRNLMAVHGGELLRDDDDDDASRSQRRKRDDSPGAGYDELDYEEDFADDEETHDPEADVVDDEEAKELEERLKREMARANHVGDDDDAAEEASAPEDEDQMLTGSGKQMMKIMRALAKREGNEAYEKDDDGRNPYATDDSDEDEEESYVANPEKAIQLAREERERKEKEAIKNKGKPGSNTPTDRQEKRPVTLGGGGGGGSSSSSQTQQRPGAGHASLAQRATSPTRGASKIGSKQVSRSSSPNLARSVSPGRAESPPLGAASDGSSSVAASTSSSGLKRRADSPATSNSVAAGSNAAVSGHPEPKRVKVGGGGGTGSRAGSPSGSPPGSKPASRAGSPGAPRVPANAVEAEIIQLIREGKIANTSELVQHFRKRLKSEPHIKDQLSAAVRKVAVMDKATNRLKLKDGF
ncbi:related to TFG1-TFIIF subunit (transcription initiation factor), 105 kD [Sporisorium reilianum f. sp. reilianum]|uniref:Related to TFG1-TFIIF subunit (Transcription initiation factor), 105 kD n=1 Tax=Sporisorium reilianum f. sp. reilianum TaxID=72559 RepID=A0A2N8UF58_9BASI|nr:related to TFG1-TFIIF subunit (transcription initiation factor), 105 kD [Sporisorium reilianum f. sp. reilianum]